VALDSFRRDFGLLNATPRHRDTLQGNIVSTFQAGCFFGSLLIFPLGERYGRKKAIMLASFIFCVGGAMMVRRCSKGLK
jgi:MFS family permease